MKVVLHDRTDLVGPELRESAQRKLTRLAHHFGKVAEADVEFSPDRKRTGLITVLCRINVHVDGRRTPLLSAHESGSDPQAAFDLAFDKIDRQVVKLKEKVKVGKKRAAPDGLGEDRERDPGPELIRIKLRPESLEDAVAALDTLDTAEQPFYVFLDEGSGSVNVCFRRRDGRLAVIEPVVP